MRLTKEKNDLKVRAMVLKNDIVEEKLREKKRIDKKAQKWLHLKSRKQGLLQCGRTLSDLYPLAPGNRRNLATCEVCVEQAKTARRERRKAKRAKLKLVSAA